MDTERIYSLSRKLAKTSYWQTIYATSKEGSLLLFKNRRELTRLQLVFINLLNFYSTLFLDIAVGDVEELVLKDDIYEDAYMYFRSKTRFKTDDVKKDNSHVSSKDKQVQLGETRILFTRPKK